MALGTFDVTVPVGEPAEVVSDEGCSSASMPAMRRDRRGACVCTVVGSDRQGSAEETETRRACCPRKRAAILLVAPVAPGPIVVRPAAALEGASSTSVPVPVCGITV